MEDHRKHSDLCNYNEVVCEKCDTKFLKNEAETHKAICDIKMQLKMKVRELEEQSIEIIRLKKEVADYDFRLKNQEADTDIYKVQLEEALNMKEIQDEVLRCKRNFNA